jgi:hypothetical protein
VAEKKSNFGREGYEEIGDPSGRMNRKEVGIEGRRKKEKDAEGRGNEGKDVRQGGERRKGRRAKETGWGGGGGNERK